MNLLLLLADTATGDDIWIKFIGSVGGAGCALMATALLTRKVITRGEHDDAMARCDALIKRLEEDRDEEKARADKWEVTAFQAVAAAKVSTATTEKAVAVLERTTAP